MNDIDEAWFALGRDFTYTGPHDPESAHAIVARHRPVIEAMLRDTIDFTTTAGRIEAAFRIVKAEMRIAELERAAGISQPDSDDMCPNCVTPWKCNGPHIP